MLGRSLTTIIGCRLSEFQCMHIVGWSKRFSCSLKLLIFSLEQFFPFFKAVSFEVSRYNERWEFFSFVYLIAFSKRII